MGENAGAPYRWRAGSRTSQAPPRMRGIEERIHARQGVREPVDDRNGEDRGSERVFEEQRIGPAAGEEFAVLPGGRIVHAASGVAGGDVATIQREVLRLEARGTCPERQIAVRDANPAMDAPRNEARDRNPYRDALAAARARRAVDVWTASAKAVLAELAVERGVLGEVRIDEHRSRLAPGQIAARVVEGRAKPQPRRPLPVHEAISPVPRSPRRGPGAAQSSSSNARKRRRPTATAPRRAR